MTDKTIVSTSPMIRPIGVEDLSSIQKINDEVQANPWSLQGIANEIDLLCKFSTVAVTPEGEVLGYLFIRESGHDFEIMSIGVARSKQNRGVGSILLGAFLTRKPEHSSVFLEVSDRNSGAIAFYQGAGFQKAGTRQGYYRDGSNATIMKLNLAKP